MLREHVVYDTIILSILSYPVLECKCQEACYRHEGDHYCLLHSDIDEACKQKASAVESQGKWYSRNADDFCPKGNTIVPKGYNLITKSNFIFEIFLKVILHLQY